MTATNPTIRIARVSVLLATLAIFLSLFLTIATQPGATTSATAQLTARQQPVTVTRSS